MPWFDLTYLLWGLVLLWFGVVGGCVGSFLNVVVYRLPAGLNLLRPGSRCPFCAVAIVPRDNIPILSWFLLRGRCRHCHLPIAARYPWVEFGVSAVFVLLAAVWLPPRSFYYRVDDTIIGQWLALLACLAMLCTWIAAALIEHDGFRVPFRLVIPFSLVAVVQAASFSWQWGIVADGAARDALSSILSGLAVASLAAWVTGPSALVSRVTWWVLLGATGCVFGANGLVAIWFLAACGRLLSVGGQLVFAHRARGGLAAWTLAILACSVACGLASVARGSVSGVGSSLLGDGGELGYFVRVASRLATMDGAWVLAIGGCAVLVSLLTSWLRPAQSQA